MTEFRKKKAVFMTGMHRHAKYTLRIAVLVLAVVVAGLEATEAAAVNYDTSWTFVYDGGKTKDGKSLFDDFRDVKVTKDGSSICVGMTGDSLAQSYILLFKFDPKGKITWKKTYRGESSNLQGGNSVFICKNNDILIGGYRDAGPWVLRLDSLGNTKWATWYYDSIRDQPVLLHGAYVNCVQETSNGSIICAAGDQYPDNDGSALNNYAAILKLDASGKVLRRMQWQNITGYDLGGWYVEETMGGCYLLSGNQTVMYIDTSSAIQWQNEYTFSLTGVGTETNNISRAKKLRNGSLLVAGQAYEGTCWTRFKALYYDAWWSPISYDAGDATSWDTAGRQGGDDELLDFTQLASGNIVFVGKRFNSTTRGGLWVFVTDSTGSTVLFEKQFIIPYKTETGEQPYPLSVSGGPDSGFTVAGEYSCPEASGAMNGFAAHFVPVPVVDAAIGKMTHNVQSAPTCRQTGQTITMSHVEKYSRLSIYNAAGKLVAEAAISGGSACWNSSRAARGSYLFTLSNAAKKVSGRFVLQ